MISGSIWSSESSITNFSIMRTIILLVLLAGIGWKLNVEQRHGRFQQADEAFLDFLLANVRDRFVADSGAADAGRVVLVRMREEDKAEYGAWPPPPIDWQMVLKGLVPFEPEVVVVTTPLNWGPPSPEFVREAGEALLPFPSVILAAEVETGTAFKAESVASLRDMLPSITRLAGDRMLLPPVSSVTAMPEETLRRQMEIGPVALPLTAARDTAMLPFAFRCGDAVVPSLALQALTRCTRMPYALQRLLVGPGAGAQLGDGVYVPLDDRGQFVVKAGDVPASVNALDFLTGELADGLSAGDKARLGKHKVIVLGLDNDAPAPTPARLHAAALSQALSLPRVRLAGEYMRWVVCGVAALLGCFLLRYRGGRALRAGLLLIFGWLVVSFVTFQSSLAWSPPAVPAAMLAAGTVFAMLFGKKPVPAA